MSQYARRLPSNLSSVASVAAHPSLQHLAFAGSSQERYMKAELLLASRRLTTYTEFLNSNNNNSVGATG